MAQYKWNCPLCTDSVVGNRKGLVYTEADNHMKTHRRSAAAVYDDVVEISPKEGK